MHAIRKTTAAKMALNANRKRVDMVSMAATKKEAMKNTWKSMTKQLTEQQLSMVQQLIR